MSWWTDHLPQIILSSFVVFNMVWKKLKSVYMWAQQYKTQNNISWVHIVHTHWQDLAIQISHDVWDLSYRLFNPEIRN